MSYYEPLPDEKQKNENIRCIIWAVCITFGWLCALSYGLAFLSWTQPTAEDIYVRRRMDTEIEVLQNQVEDLYQWRTGYENHTHIYSTGKPKKEVSK